MRPVEGDRGDTLVEILVALAVLSIGIVALSAGLTTNITTTVVNRDQSHAETVLTAASEYVKGLPTTVLPIACPGGPPQPVSRSAVPRDEAFTVTYGPAAQVGATPCDRLIQVPVTVNGNGFTLTVNVVTRA